MAITSIRNLTQRSTTDRSLRVRIIQVWDQPAWSRNEPSKEFVIVDEQGDKVQMSLALNLVDRFPEVLELSSAVLIRNFNVGSFASRYALMSYIKKRVVLTDSSFVTPINDFRGPVHGFNFTSFSEIRKPRFRSLDTIDVIGFLSRRERITTYDKNGVAKNRLAIELMDPHGHTVRCAFFGECALEVDGLVEVNCEPRPPVMIVQFAKINEYQESLSLINAYHGTKVYYNDDLPEMTDLRSRLQETGVEIPDVVVINPRPPRGDSGYLQGSFRDCRYIRLDELRNQLLVGCYGAYATIDCLHVERGWFFTCCRRCNKGVKYGSEIRSSSATSSQLTSTDLVCGCGINRALQIPKFRLDLTAVDESGSASLTLFGEDIERLIGVSCREVRQREVPESVYPDELNNLIGLTLLFKVEVAAFNIERNHAIYTCNDVTNKIDVIRPYLESRNIMMELLSPVRPELPLIDLESDKATTEEDDSPLGKRKLESSRSAVESSISPTKLAKQFVDVDIKKK